MTKPKRFVEADNKHSLSSKAALLASLEETERTLLDRYPRIQDGRWYLELLTRQDAAEEWLAIGVMERLQGLRDALLQDDTPAWKAAALGMWFQDRLRDLWQPEEISAIGRVNRGRGPTHVADDELTLIVLSQLRASGMTWQEALFRLEAAAENDEEIAGVEVYWRSAIKKWEFRQRRDGGTDKIEKYSKSTLQRKKWPKAKP